MKQLTQNERNIFQKWVFDFCGFNSKGAKFEFSKEGYLNYLTISGTDERRGRYEFVFRVLDTPKFSEYLNTVCRFSFVCSVF